MKTSNELLGEAARKIETLPEPYLSGFMDEIEGQMAGPILSAMQFIDLLMHGTALDLFAALLNATPATAAQFISDIAENYEWEFAEDEADNKDDEEYGDEPL